MAETDPGYGYLDRIRLCCACALSLSWCERFSSAFAEDADEAHKVGARRGGSGDPCGLPGMMGSVSEEIEG